MPPELFAHGTQFFIPIFPPSTLLGQRSPKRSPHPPSNPVGFHAHPAACCVSIPKSRLCYQARGFLSCTSASLFIFPIVSRPRNSRMLSITSNYRRDYHLPGLSPSVVPPWSPPQLDQGESRKVGGLGLAWPSASCWVPNWTSGPKILAPCYPLINFTPKYSGDTRGQLIFPYFLFRLFQTFIINDNYYFLIVKKLFLDFFL